MAVSLILYVLGDAADLQRRYDAGWTLVPQPDEAGLLYHCCLVMPDGIKVIGHFTDRSAADRYLTRPEVEAALAEVRLADRHPAFVPLHAAWAADRSAQ